MKGRDLISMLDLNRSELETLFDIANEMKRYVKSGTDILKNRVLSTLFFEPSTRTRLSFETAMIRLGGNVIGFADPSTSRMTTGETLSDTIRMLDSYSNVIVMRHRIEGSSRLAAEVAAMPVLNAGDGSQHHPTQTLTDLYTMRKEFGQIDGLKIAILGDLRQTRSASSLCFGVSNYKDLKLYLISPEPLRMRQEVKDHLDASGIEYIESSTLEPYLSELNVLYVTRLQKERFADPTEYEKLKGSYIVTTEMLEKAKKGMIVMHHLPRIDEIPLEIDYTTNARYFEQAANGLPVRMALLSMIVD
ncbi:MAG: aspartate carbamoyltransferase [archaeon]|nr:aspartate carbamoyltransferase [archaeon]